MRSARFPQAAPTFANAQLASYRAHTTLYLEKPSCGTSSCLIHITFVHRYSAMSNGCAILSRCASSWKLIYHFDFSLLFDMNFIQALARYIHS